ncbi:hypothetical protein D3C73_1251870 [compost metagenome]
MSSANFGSRPSTTWYWFSGPYMTDTWRWLNELFSTVDIVAMLTPSRVAASRSITRSIWRPLSSTSVSTSVISGILAMACCTLGIQVRSNCRSPDISV